MINLEAIKSSSYIEALHDIIARRCESIIQTARCPSGMSPSDIDQVETKLKECTIALEELKKLQ